MNFISVALYVIKDPNGAHAPHAKIWRPSKDLYLKINMDAVFNQSTCRGYFGAICRDNRGKLLTACCNTLFATSALVAKALAMRGVVLLGQSLHVSSVLFESDCLTLIQPCRK